MNDKIISLKTKLYQMFILGLDGGELENNPNLINALEQGLGGVIFFTQNILSIEQTKKLTKDIKDASKIPPFLSIDQEGGRVERTENLFKDVQDKPDSIQGFNQESRLGFPTQQQNLLNPAPQKKFLSAKFGAEKGEEFVKEQTEQISHLLKELGFNLNFAPVLDVNTNPDNPIIGERAFSNDTDEVIKFGKIVVDTYMKNGIIPCTKHFPGHGDASVDSHISLPRIDLSLEEMEEFHIRPFKEVPSPMIMVAHLHCPAFDKEVIPSSLSKNVIGYLRNNLKYDGLIITDDMVMGGVTGRQEGKKIRGQASHCSLAIKAGVNILLYRNSCDETIQIIEELAQIAQNDPELSRNIEQSYNRIIQFKHNNEI